MSKQLIFTSHAPAAIGPYSQAIRVGQWLYTSGQIPLNPATGELVAGGIVEQTEQVMNNLAAVLEAAGLSFAQVVKTTIFLTDLGSFSQVNEVYARRFTDTPPARSTVQVAALPRGALVEIELVAVEG